MSVARARGGRWRQLGPVLGAVLVGAVVLHPHVSGAAVPAGGASRAADGRGLDATSGTRCTVVGTMRADILLGTRRADVICGRAGNDVVRGRGGNDRLNGGPGADLVEGGGGADKVNGGAGNDRLFGGPGADSLEARDGGPFIDRLSCGRGADVPLADRRDVVGHDCEGRAPRDISLAPARVREHEPATTRVGTFTTSDPDLGDAHTYALVSGAGDAGNRLFAIVGATLMTAAPLDHESHSSYTVRVRSTDRARRSVEKVFAITVVDVNEPPGDIALSGASVTENEPVGTTVGTLSASDPDMGDAHIYALVSGAGESGNGLFAIAGATLKTAAGLDRESNSAHSVRVQATDRAGRSVVKVFAITIANANEPPAEIALSRASVAEHEPAATTVGMLMTSDPDLGDSHTYSLVAGPGDPGNGAFRIEGAALKTAAALDYESSPSYAVRIRATDSAGRGVERAFAIAVSDVVFDAEGVVDGIHAESSSRLGPFLDSNGNLYFLSETELAGPDPAAEPNPAMRRSIDGGGTWTEVDAANRPTGSEWWDLESVWVQQDGSTLRILRQRSVEIEHNVAYYEFKTSDDPAQPDTWALKEPVVGELAPGTKPDDQAVALAVRSNGDLYAFYRAPRTGTDDRVAYRKKPAGGAWGDEVVVAAAPGVRYTQIQAILGEDDLIHVFYKDDTNNEIEHRTLNNDDVLSAARVVNDTPTSASEHAMATPAVYADVNGVERIVVAWARADGVLVSAVIDDGVIGPQEAVSSVPAWIGGGVIGSRQVVATLAVDPVTDALYALYADAGTHDVHRDTWDGGWGADTEALDAVEAQYISANVFARAGNRVLAVVYDDNPTGALDAGVPKYREFVLAPAPAGAP